jgi:hypothetical protein
MDKLYRKKLEKIFNKIDKIASQGKDQYILYYEYIDDLIQKGDYGAFEQTLYYFYGIDIINVENVRDVKKQTWEEVTFQSTTPFLKKLSIMYKKRGVYQDSYDIHTTDTSAVSIGLSDPLSITYSTTGLTPSINLEKVGDVINLEIYEEDIYNIQIFRSEWVDSEPTNNDIIQNINVGTQSSFQTQIPLTHTRQYLITAYQRDVTGYPGHYIYLNYKVDITKDSLLGQIKEIESHIQENVNYLLKNKQYARLVGEVLYYLEVHKNGTTTIIDYDNPSFSYDQNLLKRYELALDVLLS